jgi:simple sugar transport system ATP-binding protein
LSEVAEESFAQNYKHIVRVEGVNVSYGKIRALSDIDLAIGRNEIVGLIGDNGAEKRP